MAGRKTQRQRQPTVRLLSLFLLVFSLAAGIWWFVRDTVEPNLEEIGRMRAQSLVTKMINKAINDQFRRETDTDQLIIRRSNQKGETEMVQVDAQAMNLLITEISQELQDEYMNMEQDEVDIPLGALIGSKVLSQTGPRIAVDIMPLSVSGMDFRTEFEAAGINQTKYKVYLVLESQVKLLAPFSSRTLNLSNTILMAEAVILGSVPDSYVQVPKEDILDVTEE